MNLKDSSPPPQYNNLNHNTFFGCQSKTKSLYSAPAAEDDLPKLVLPGIRREIYRCMIFPAIAVLFISAILLLVKQIEAGYSAFLGGMVWVIPNGFVAAWLFSNVSARAAQRIVLKFYIAEALKLLLTIVFFIGIVKFLPLSLGFFLVGYLVAQISFWITAALYMK